jgi:hypothetical protein
MAAITAEQNKKSLNYDFNININNNICSCFEELIAIATSITAATEAKCDETTVTAAPAIKTTANTTLASI